MQIRGAERDEWSGTMKRIDTKRGGAIDKWYRDVVVRRRGQSLR